MTASIIATLVAALVPVVTMIAAAFSWHRSRMRAAELKIERANIEAVVEAKKIQDDLNALSQAEVDKKWREWGVK